MSRPANNPSTELDRGAQLAMMLEAGLLGCALVLLFLWSRGEARLELRGQLAINFFAILIEAVPFMLVGTVVGGLIEALVPRRYLSRALEGRGTLAVFLGAGLGAVFPICECAIVPVVRRLLKKGVPFSAAVAFLLAGPVVNPVVAASTAVAYQYHWEMVIVRLVCGYAIAVGVGLALGTLFARSDPLKPGFMPACGCAHHHDHDEAGWRARLAGALGHACDDFFEVGRFLVIGAFLAALARTLVPLSVFETLSARPWLAILLMMLLAVALNLCSEADAFIASSFRGVMPPAAQAAFLVLGPMLDIKLVLMYLTVFRKRTIVALATAVTLAVLAVMLGLAYGLPLLGVGGLTDGLAR